MEDLLNLHGVPRTLQQMTSSGAIAIGAFWFYSATIVYVLVG